MRGCDTPRGGAAARNKENNQPFGKNILADTPERRSFAANFDIDPLQISQLYLGARNGDFYAALGRFVTPFGRFYFPNYRNNFDDSPFIRSEAIRFRETGMLLQWDPSIWVFTAAITNGGFEQDGKSSKAFIGRRRPNVSARRGARPSDRHRLEPIGHRHARIHRPSPFSHRCEARPIS